MSLMAELGEGPPPQKTNSMMPSAPKQFNPPNQPMSHSRFNQPPPNPMVSFACAALLYPHKTKIGRVGAYIGATLLVSPSVSWSVGYSCLLHICVTP